MARVWPDVVTSQFMFAFQAVVSVTMGYAVLMQGLKTKIICSIAFMYVVKRHVHCRDKSLYIYKLKAPKGRTWSKGGDS